MTEPGPRRSSLPKRLVLGTSALLLVLASYVAGEPFIVGTALCRCRVVMPVLSIVYRPLYAYRMHGLPAAEPLKRYSTWGTSRTIVFFRPDAQILELPEPMPVLP